MNPHEYCHNKAAQSGSSFFQSFRFLPTPTRQAMMALYAFCREVDDVVDEDLDPQHAAGELARWRAEIQATWQGQAQHPVGLALQEVLRDTPLPEALFHDILDGMAMDLGTTVRYASFDDLRLYCHRVAGVVGELSARIFGHSQDQTLAYSHELGLALQLINIIRDVGEDAQRGRIYLPQDELARFGVSNEALLQRQDSPAFHALMQFQAERAEHHYQQALALLPEADRARQRPGLTMGLAYHSLLDEIRRQGFPVLRQRVRLAPWQKLRLMSQVWLGA